MNIKNCNLLAGIVALGALLVNCSHKKADPPKPGAPVVKVKYDGTGCLYKSYNNLVMAGYQGRFAAESDESQRGWYEGLTGQGAKWFHGESGFGITKPIR